jgi:hypothetical protein
MTTTPTTVYARGVGAIEVKIENSVPPPVTATASWPIIFSQMKVGDSFVVPIGVVGTVRTARYKLPSSEGRKFAFRKIAPDQFRCWRTA